jgi:hypothetical protein
MPPAAAKMSTVSPSSLDQPYDFPSEVQYDDSGGFDLSLPSLDSATYAGVYPPLAGQGAFSVSIATPASQPSLSLMTGGLPLLRINGLPVQLELAGSGQQPLAATVALDLQLEPVFLKCDDCVIGREASFLDLLRNLLCIARLGLIQISGNPATALECVLHLYAIALRPSGETALRQASVTAPGTFPQPVALAQLESLLKQVLPQALVQLAPVPILFDFFHVIPDGVRLTSIQQVNAHSGWFTLMLPLGIPS